MIPFARASAETLDIFIDADFSKSRASASAIELGIKTALEEVDNQLGGYDIRLVPKDHRTNVKRSHRHIQELGASETALLMFGGMHSPQYLSYRDYINENQILTLLPWSAAGPITRAAPGHENWLFRLSVDDYQSGEFLVNAAITQGGCQSISLLLLDTGWGLANRTTLEAALAAHDLSANQVAFFPTSIGDAGAGALAAKLATDSPDCIIMLSNWHNGAAMINAMRKHLPDVKIFSHWGITGGAFAEQVPHETRAALSLSVLQTCGLRRERDGNALLQWVLRRALPDAQGLADVSAPTGFVHGYDLTRILIAAADQAATTPAWQGSIVDKRRALKSALESLSRPVTGILKTYQTPFSAYDPQTAPNAHEALGLADLCLARFDANGRLEDLR
ncbi:ABC transporter substrate-binding protein [Tritonibacter horizontis]|nr:ABC transporter substrate-binding protein [Tritonibacter horizontis]